MRKYNFEEFIWPNNKTNDSEPEYYFYSPYEINLDRPKPNYDKSHRSLKLKEE